MKRTPSPRTISNPWLNGLSANPNGKKPVKGRKRKASLFLALLFLTAASSMVGIMFGFQKIQEWEVLQVQHIEMDGLAKVKPDEVRLYVGHVVGKPILSVHGGELEKTLVTHPWVKWAKVERIFPNTLKVRLVEHQPVAILSAKNLYLLDAQGIPFKELAPDDELDLPLVTGIDEVIIKEDRKALREKILLAFKAQRAFAKTNNRLLGNLNEIQIEPVVGVSLRTSKGIHAVFGHKLFQEKVEKLKEMVEHLPERDRFSATFLLGDDRLTDRVTIRFNESEPARTAKVTN